MGRFGTDGGELVFWDEETIQAVWEKGRSSGSNDEHRWRKDACGAWICRQDYRNRDSEYGWEIGLIAFDGPYEFANLRPMNWQNNVFNDNELADCKITAHGKHNVRA
jgi:hypothetical protein